MPAEIHFPCIAMETIPAGSTCVMVVDGSTGHASVRLRRNEDGEEDDAR